MRYLLIATIVATLGSQAYAMDNTAFLRQASAEFIIPRYDALRDAMERQRAAWQTSCDGASGANRAALRISFKAAADAWSSIEFIRIGPISKNNRHERMAHWPERKNAVGKALTGLTNRDDGEVFQPRRFSETSVAGQGLSALERLLFDDGMPSSNMLADRYCAIGRAIAGSLATIASDVAGEWRQSPDLGEPRETVTRLATDLLGVYQMVGDLKLEAIMGDSAERARPALAEGWRSGRSTRAIVLNLRSIEAFMHLISDPANDNGSVLGALATAIRIAEGLPADFAPLAEDPRQRYRLILLLDAVRAARDLSLAFVPQALGITVGFNSLDGD